MFQNSFLIIKSDYMHRRKPLLIYLLRSGFQIQASRKVQFTPELAAEFYQDDADEPTFMIQVILLSKGVSEAFILTKENAVEDLLNTMVCYFGTSTEMYRNIHVTRCSDKVKFEITYVFPNYIHEPIFYMDKINFCNRNPIVKPICNELYDVIKNKEIDHHSGWKTKLIEFLKNTNREVPTESNQCARNPSAHVQEQGQQTIRTSFDQKRAKKRATAVGSASGSLRSLDFSCNINSSSLNFSTSSCLSCTQFSSQDDCIRQVYAKRPIVDLVKAKTAPLKIKAITASPEKEKKEMLDKAVGPQYSFLYDWLDYNLEEESYEDHEKDTLTALDAAAFKQEQIKTGMVTAGEHEQETTSEKREHHSDDAYLQSNSEIADEAKTILPIDQYANEETVNEEIANTLIDAADEKPPEPDAKSEVEINEDIIEPLDDKTDEDEAKEIKTTPDTDGDENTIEENKPSSEGE